MHLVQDPQLYIELSLNRAKSQEFCKQNFLTSLKQKSSRANFNFYAEKFSYQEIIKMQPQDVFNCNRKLKKIVQIKLRKGDLIPDSSKREIWLHLAHVNYYICEYAGYYNRIKDYPKYPQYYADTIEKDVLRTIQLKCNNMSKQEHEQKLRDILNQYAKRNPFIGYCQGLNYIASFFLRFGFNEEQSFWFLVSLIENFIQLDYYNNMYGVLSEDKALQTVLQTNLPKLYEKFQEIQLSTGIFTVQWFVCLFLFNVNEKVYKNPSFSIQISYLIMDNLFAQGSISLIKSALTYFMIFQETLLQCEDMGSTLLKLEQEIKAFDDVQQFQNNFNKIYINKRIYEYAKDLFRKQIIEEKIQMDLNPKQQQKITTQKQYLKSIRCNPQDPLCIYGQELQKIEKQYLDQFVYRCAHQIEVIDDYFINKQENKRKSYSSIWSSLVIGRDHHQCVLSERLVTDFQSDWFPTQNQNGIQLLSYFENSKLDNGKSYVELYNKDIFENTSISQNIEKKQNDSRRQRSPIKELLLFPLKLFDTDIQISSSSSNTAREPYREIPNEKPSVRYQSPKNISKKLKYKQNQFKIQKRAKSPNAKYNFSTQEQSSEEQQDDEIKKKTIKQVQQTLKQEQLIISEQKIPKTTKQGSQPIINSQAQIKQSYSEQQQNRIFGKQNLTNNLDQKLKNLKCNFENSKNEEQEQYKEQAQIENFIGDSNTQSLARLRESKSIMFLQQIIFQNESLCQLIMSRKNSIYQPQFQNRLSKEASRQILGLDENIKI